MKLPLRQTEPRHEIERKTKEGKPKNKKSDAMEKQKKKEGRKERIQERENAFDSTCPQIPPSNARALAVYVKTQRGAWLE